MGARDRYKEACVWARDRYKEACVGAREGGPILLSVCWAERERPRHGALPTSALGGWCIS